MKHATLFKKQFTNAEEFKSIAFQYIYPIGDIDLLFELPLNNNEPYSGLFEQVNRFNFV